MDNDCEMDTDITITNVKTNKKKRTYMEMMGNLSTQMDDLNIHRKKFKINSNNDYRVSHPKQEVCIINEHKAVMRKKEEEEKGSKETEEAKVIDMEIERKLVADYYEKKNKMLNRMMFGDE